MILFKADCHLTDDQIRKEREKIQKQLDDGKVILINSGIDFIGIFQDSDEVQVVKK